MRDPFEGVTDRGMIRTGAHRDRVPVEFEAVLAAASKRLARDPRASLYLYGSVATGQARSGSSDVDLLAVDADSHAVTNIGRELSELFKGTCREVEIGQMRPADLDGEHDAAYGSRVFLRHYCVHLAGPNRHAALLDFPAEDLKALVSWADGKVVPNREEVARMLATPLDDLVHRFESRIGLWR